MATLTVTETQINNGVVYAEDLRARKTPAEVEAGVDNAETLNTYFSRTKNLINPDNWNVGFFQGADGVPVANSTYSVTDFIEVSEGDYIFTDSVNNEIRFLTAYDADKQVIEAEGSDSAVTEFTVAAGTAFVKLTVFTARTEHMLQEGNARTGYTPYGGYPTDKFLIPKANLFNKNTVTADTFQGANGVPAANATYSLSDFIEVEAGATYTYSGGTIRFATAYDKNFSVVEASGSDDELTQIVVPVSGVKYYKITVFNSQLSTGMLNKGSYPLPYVDWGYKPFSIDTANAAKSAGYENGVMVSFGDSITAQNEWQGKVASRLQMTSDVEGIGGSQVSGTASDAFWQDARVNTIDANADIVIVMGGTNDWAQSAVLGAIDSSNTNEFNGAFNVMIEKIINRCPLARIVINTTPYGEIPNFAPRGWDNAYTNNAGLTTNDYAQACREQALRWNLPLADVNRDCGWNTLNLESFMKDDGAFIHPDELGADRLAGVVIGTLESLPINNASS